MFTNKKAKYNGDNNVLIDAACLSSDTKPTTGIANGSKCIEMDTGKTYMFNEEDSEWEELPSSGGGGGSSLVVTFTQNGDVYSADKTFDEIKAAYLNGETVKGYFTRLDLGLTDVFYLSQYVLATEVIPEESINFHNYDYAFFTIESNNEVTYTSE